MNERGSWPALEAGQDRKIPVRVWDLPVRLFHWLIVALFVFSWWTAETEHLDWHMLSGYGILALLIFRLYWGLVGSRTARFAGFLKGPKAVFAYSTTLLNRSNPPTPGHNPMGGWSVVALIALLLLQVGLGLFAIDVEGLTGGPLDYLVSFEAGRRIAGLHNTLFDLLMILVGLHLTAILFYWVYKRENLIAAMITGLKPMPKALEAPRFTRLWWAIPGLLAAGLIVAWVAQGGRF